jgi:hypothetical protein
MLSLKTPRKRRCLLDYPPELRGPPNNRYGGHNAHSLRCFKNNTFGPASPVRHYTPAQIREYEHIKLGKNCIAKNDN